MLRPSHACPLTLNTSLRFRGVLPQPGQQDLASHCSSLLYCTTQCSNQFPSFLSITVPVATWGNSSITLWPNPSLMMFGHSKAHLRLSKSLFSDFMLSPWRAYSKTNPAVLNVCAKNWMFVCEYPLQLLPVFLLIWDLDRFWVCLWLHVERVWRKRAMFQEKHMALLG